MNLLRRLLFLALGAGALAGPARLVSAEPPPSITPQDLIPFANLAQAQRSALAQGKPVGFLLTWPIFFTGANGFHASGAEATAHFAVAFRDRAVLVNVNHATGELDRVPRVALQAFHSPAEGGFAPCLCLVNPTFTKLIGIIPLRNTYEEREQLFRGFQAMIADRASWWDAPPHAGPGPAPALQPAAVAPPPGTPSAAFARELELTRQAELRARPTPTPPR